MTGRCGVSPRRWVTEDGNAGRSREEISSLELFGWLGYDQS